VIRQYGCLFCSYRAEDLNDLLDHRKVHTAQDKKEVFDAAHPDSTKHDYWCKWCDYKCNVWAQFSSHLYQAKHLKGKLMNDYKKPKAKRIKIACAELNCSFWCFRQDKFDEHKEEHRAEKRAAAKVLAQATVVRLPNPEATKESGGPEEIQNRASSAPPAVPLPQLLQEIGEDNLQWQLLSQCLHSGDALKNGKGTKLQFVTQEPLGPVALLGTRNAFIVWVDNDRIKPAYEAALKKASLGGGPNSQEPAPNPPPPPEQPLVTATTALPVEQNSVDDPSAAPEVFHTAFCNKGHRMEDGMPVDHECYVLPPRALQLEREGKLEEAQNLLHEMVPPERRRTSRGVRLRPIEEEAPKKAGPVPMEYFERFVEIHKPPFEDQAREDFAIAVRQVNRRHGLPSALVDAAPFQQGHENPELRFVGTSEAVQVVHTYSAGSEKPIFTEHKPGGQYIVVTGEGVLRKGQELLVQLPPDVELVKKEPKVAAYPKQGSLLVAAGIDFDRTSIKAELVPTTFFTCEGCGRTGVSTPCKGQTKCTECLDIESGNSVSKLADLNGVPRQYYEGYCASRDTKARTENPYPPGEDHRLWNAGFDWAQSFHGLRAKIPQTNLFTVKIRLFGRPEDKPRDHLLVVAAFSEQDARVKAQVWRDSNKWYGSDLLHVGLTTDEELQGDYFKTDEAEPLIELREKWGLAPPMPQPPQEVEDKLSWQSCSAPIPYEDQKDIEGARMLMGRWDADTQRWCAIWEGTAERVEQDAQRLDFGAYKASTRAGTMYVNPTHYILVDNLPKP
jgi:hypothetical protein